MTREDLQPYFDTYPKEGIIYVVGEGRERQMFVGSEKVHADNYARAGRQIATFYRDPLDQKDSDDDVSDPTAPSVKTDFLTEKDLTAVTKAVETLVKVK